MLYLNSDETIMDVKPRMASFNVIIDPEKSMFQYLSNEFRCQT